MNPMKRLFHIIALVTLLILVDFSTAQGDSLPDSTYISGVRGHAQGYSLSCEARSAADWAAFWGMSIEETEFLDALPYSDNPNQGYVGDPNEVWGRLPPHGYGVHAEPVAETLRDFGLKAEALTDLSWDDLREEISAGRPVIVWIIGAMWGGTPVEYEASDGSTARVAAFEHTMILTGYSSGSVQVVDAYSGQYQYYWLNTFLNSWAVLGNMAVLGSGEANHQDETPPEAHGESYTVQKGDYLIALAKRFGISWQELAELNSIGYPYVIHPGQVLQLPGGATPEAEPVPEPTPEPVAEVAKPALRIQVINFRVRLPVIRRNMAAGLSPSNEVTPAVQAPIATVVVLHGDTLLNFADSIDVDWLQLVELNKLQFPYVVHPGQVLRVR
jgi:LysM repeat protein/uncharacterized protein YvpB